MSRHIDRQTKFYRKYAQSDRKHFLSISFDDSIKDFMCSKNR